MSFYVGRKAIRKVPGTVINAIPLPKPKIDQRSKRNNHMVRDRCRFNKLFTFKNPH